MAHPDQCSDVKTYYNFLREDFFFLKREIQQDHDELVNQLNTKTSVVRQLEESLQLDERISNEIGKINWRISNIEKRLEDLTCAFSQLKIQ